VQRGENSAPKHYPTQGGKDKGTRSTPYYTLKELLSLPYYIITTQIVIKCSQKEKKEKGKACHLRINPPF